MLQLPESQLLVACFQLGGRLQVFEPQVWRAQLLQLLLELYEKVSSLVDQSSSN